MSAPADAQATAAAAGLARALELFPEDVAAALAQAEALKRALAAPLDPADEPWTPWAPA